MYNSSHRDITNLNLLKILCLFKTLNRSQLKCLDTGCFKRRFICESMRLFLDVEGIPGTHEKIPWE